ncbi:MAG: hypothetical protein Q8P01_02010 [bacterium]|nr:hypothetical protein [bacterium]MDP2703975.1 hypothetical protein [bacterium]
MTTVTIPKEAVGKKELVAIPQDLYEEFLKWQNMLKSMRVFIPTAAQKRDVIRAREEYKKGSYLTLDECRQKLGIKS